MWNFLAREANWTEIVTNTLALSFSFMGIAIIIHAAIFSDHPDMLATAGSVSSGVTGVILGYYFNRSRLKRAQDAESRKDTELSDISDAVLKSERELSELQLEYDRLSSVLGELTSSQVVDGGEDGEV
ncbi:MAG: hypothetical protein F4X94_03070 [Dehalococcoidia bacterium]|nr:hypothetical protein [Dehalococcoidia bacterium]